MMGSPVSAADNEFETLRPEVRADALVRHYDNEIVAWSPSSRAPTYLDPVAALIFQILDGNASVADLVGDVHEFVGVPEAVARSQIRRVISQLHSAGLLTTSTPSDAPNVQLDLFPGPLNP